MQRKQRQRPKAARADWGSQQAATSRAATASRGTAPVCMVEDGGQKMFASTSSLWLKSREWWLEDVGWWLEAQG